MSMWLMGLCFAFIGLAFTAVAFVAATRPVALRPEAQPQPVAVKPALARFFSEPLPQPGPIPIQVPIEALLLQIENHVRLEQAAAESFVACPTHTLLHSKTTSQFVN